jgi:hypothetical protein
VIAAKNRVFQHNPPISAIHAFDANVRFGAEAMIDRTASMGAVKTSVCFSVAQNICFLPKWRFGPRTQAYRDDQDPGVAEV